MTALFQSCNRGKRSIVVDLQKSDGRDLVRTLANESDVFVQNFRPGVIERLGLGERDLRRDHADLVYVSIDGLGSEGTWANRPAFDAILQGMTGALYVQSDPPTMMKQTWCDKSTALTVAQAITAALFARERGGSGQHLRVSMLDAALSFLWPDCHEHTTIVGEDGATLMPSMVGSLTPIVTRDGYATIMAVTDDQLTRLVIAVGKEQLLADSRFSTDARNEHISEWRAELARGYERFTTAELIALLHEADVPCGPVLRPEEVPGFDPVVTNSSIVELDHPVMGRIRQPRSPARFDGIASANQRPAPSLGEHTDAVLRELGRSPAEIERLRADKIVE